MAPTVVVDLSTLVKSDAQPAEWKAATLNHPLLSQAGAIVRFFR